MNPNEVKELTPDAIRQEAEARRLTIEPVSQDITPEEEPASVQAARHANGPAIANAPNDTEQNAPSIVPAGSLRPADKPRPPHSRHVNRAAVAALIFLVGIVAAIIIYVLV